MMGRFSQRQVLITGGVVLAIVLLIVVGTVVGRRGSGEAAFRNLLAQDTLHVVSELEIHLPPRLRGRERPFTLITAQLDGDVAPHADQTPEFTGQMNLQARGRGVEFFADGDIRVLRDQVLFNLDNLPVFLNPSGSLVKKWTRVEASLLQTQNPEAVFAAFRGMASALRRDGSEEVDGKRLVRYRATLTEDEERALADVLRRKASGNQGLDSLARLLDANVMKSLTIWVDGREVRRLRAHFVRPLSQGREFDFATLTMTFTEYGKKVAIDAPAHQLTVRPQVFANLFGGGEIEEVKTEEEKKSSE